ncbi:sulfurtransferase complex subunit TusD [Buchnera aphidicola]|uniref:sulfurtransferase complex subunit TusD n=1 Tax=Buchnera aphidicola TaxID=9 RepID=UPI00346494E9
MIYTVIITSSVYSVENSISALLFSRALIMRRIHFIKNIFFYCDGALHANKFLFFNKKDIDIRRKWIIFSLKNKIKLHVCYSSLLKQGIIDFKKFFRKNTSVGNLDIFFRISSLEKLSRDIQKSDRVIKF